MQIKKMGMKILTSLLPDRQSILPILGGPLAGRKLCCRFKIRPHYLLGHYEKEVMEAISENLRPGHIAYDIGANIGYLTLAMAKRVSQKKGGRVYAFEPSPNTFLLLATNTQLNRQWPVEPYQVALSDTSGIGVFSSFDYDVVSRLGDHTSQYHDAQTSHVRVETLDSFISQFELPPPDFVKIDVEGFELHVLRGMRHLLETAHPTMIIETHTLEENGVRTVDSIDQVIAMLTEIGYTCTCIQKTNPQQCLAVWKQT